MAGRSRITYQPASASSGGGGAPTIGHVEWGPSFGQSAGDDQSTFDVGIHLTQPALALSNTKPVGVHVTMPELVAIYNAKSVGVNLTMPELGLVNTKSVGVHLTQPSLALENTKSVGVQLTQPALALVNTKSVGVHLSGTALGAPFWQSETHNAGTSPTATNLTLTVPSPINDGDLMIAFVSASGVAATITPPAGWTLEESVATTPFLNCYSRVASSEPVSYNWAIGGTTINFAGGIHRIIGFNTSDPTDIDAQSNASATDPVGPAVVTTVVNTLVIGCVAQTPATAATFTPPAGWLERWDQAGGTVSPNCQSSITRVFAAAGSTGTQTYDSSTLVAAAYSCITIAIAPGTIVLAT